MGQAKPTRAMYIVKQMGEADKLGIKSAIKHVLRRMPTVSRGQNKNHLETQSSMTPGVGRVHQVVCIRSHEKNCFCGSAEHG